MTDIQVLIVLKNLLLLSEDLDNAQRTIVEMEIDAMIVDEGYRRKCCTLQNKTGFIKKQGKLPTMVSRLIYWEMTNAGDAFWRNVQKSLKRGESSRSKAPYIPRESIMF